MKIYGAGLPRTGTTSLAKALEILGYNVAHYCPITNPSTRDQLFLEHDAYVSSELLLGANLNVGIWIILEPPNRWEESMYYMGADVCDWQDHMKALDVLKGAYGINILHFNVDTGWWDLCKFLGKPIPEEDFHGRTEENDYQKRISRVLHQVCRNASL